MRNFVARMERGVIREQSCHRRGRTLVTLALHPGYGDNRGHRGWDN